MVNDVGGSTGPEADEGRVIENPAPPDDRSSLGRKSREEPRQGAENPPILPNNVRQFRPREEQKTKPKKKQAVKSSSSLGRKSREEPTSSLGRKHQIDVGEDEDKWLKNLLPKTIAPGLGWWDVTGNGAGFIIKFKWNAGGESGAQTFPRISREQFEKLQEMTDYERRTELSERIAGHLDDLTLDPARRNRAVLVASRIGVELENYQDAGRTHLTG